MYFAYSFLFFLFVSVSSCSLSLSSVLSLLPCIVFLFVCASFQYFHKNIHVYDVCMCFLYINILNMCMCFFFQTKWETMCTMHTYTCWPPAVYEELFFLFFLFFFYWMNFCGKTANDFNSIRSLEYKYKCSITYIVISDLFVEVNMRQNILARKFSSFIFEQLCNNKNMHDSNWQPVWSLSHAGTYRKFICLYKATILQFTNYTSFDAILFNHSILFGVYFQKQRLGFFSCI